MIIEIDKDDFKGFIVDRAQVFYQVLSDRIEMYIAHGGAFLRANIPLKEHSEEEIDNAKRNYDLFRNIEITDIYVDSYHKGTVVSELPIKEEPEENEEEQEYVEEIEEEMDEEE